MYRPEILSIGLLVTLVNKMKTRYSLLLAAFMGMTFLAFGQGHTDLKENGLEGRVRKVITYVYDSAYKENNEWLPLESSFHSRITYFYNQKGNNDSTHYLVRVKELGHDIQRRTIYTFSNDKRSGYREYENDDLVETASITWIDQHNYLTRARYTNTDEVAELMNALNDSYRDLRGEVRIFNAEGNMVFCSSYENKLEGNLLSSVLTMDCLSNDTSSSSFIYGQLDEYRNPVLVISIDPSNGKPQKIWVRKIEYY